MGFDVEKDRKHDQWETEWRDKPRERIGDGDANRRKYQKQHDKAEENISSVNVPTTMERRSMFFFAIRLKLFVAVETGRTQDVCQWNDEEKELNIAQV